MTNRLPAMQLALLVVDVDGVIDIQRGASRRRRSGRTRQACSRPAAFAFIRIEEARYARLTKRCHKARRRAAYRPPVLLRSACTSWRTSGCRTRGHRASDRAHHAGRRGDPLAHICAADADRRPFSARRLPGVGAVPYPPSSAPEKRRASRCRQCRRRRASKAPSRPSLVPGVGAGHGDHLVSTTEVFRATATAAAHPRAPPSQQPLRTSAPARPRLRSLRLAAPPPCRGRRSLSSRRVGSETAGMIAAAMRKLRASAVA